MDLKLEGKEYLILGASSGFGENVARRIAKEGGRPILVARSEDSLKAFCAEYPAADYIVSDLFAPDGVSRMMTVAEERDLAGVLINAGGPPSGSFPMEKMEQWDNAYRQVLRWKIDLLDRILPLFQSRNFGRLVMIESVSVKEPLKGLVLSNVFRAASQALMKSIVNEMSGYDILINLLAPGYHKTARLESLIKTESEKTGRSISEIEAGFAANTPVGALGDPASFAQLAVWLLSPQNQYVNGQSFVVDGGMNKSL